MQQVETVLYWALDTASVQDPEHSLHFLTMFGPYHFLVFPFTMPTKAFLAQSTPLPLSILDPTSMPILPDSIIYIMVIKY